MRNCVPQSATAGKLIGPRSLRARGVAGITTSFIVLLAILCGLLLSVGGGVAWGAIAPAPAWQVTDVAIPSVLPTEPGRKGKYAVVVENIGGADSAGTVRVRDVLPEGLSVTRVKSQPEEGPLGETECTNTAEEVVCEFPIVFVPSGFLVININYEVTGVVSGGLRNVASVSGGGAAEAVEEATSRTGALHETGPAGISQFRMTATGPAGEPMTQAGGHPNFLTTTLLLNNQRNESVGTEFKPVAPTKDLEFYLPLGMLGNPSVTEPCPASLVQVHEEVSGCPPSSRVGSALPMILNVIFANTRDPTNVHGIYSMQPEKGYAAEFAFGSNGITFFTYASVVRRDGAYVLRIEIPGVPPVAALLGLVATFYGDIQEHYSNSSEEFVSDRGAFLTDPSDCGASGAALNATAEIDTWVDPASLGGPTYSQSHPVFSGLEGCDLLSSGFSATLAAAPNTLVAGSTTQADEPSGYKLDLETPQAPNSGTGLGSPPYKSVDFTFPEGTSLSPGAANGLVACSATGPNGIDIPSETPRSATEAGEGEEIGPDGLAQPSAGHCPSSSEVGTAHASTPLLREELQGHLYLAEPGCGNAAHPNPCTSEDAANGTLYRLYLELEAPERGVIIKLPGKALANPMTGRITTVFEGTPQFPVSNLVVETSGGPRASLANSQSCGTATTTGLITSWSSPQTLPATPSGSFNVTGCSGAFAPAFSAGTTSTQAGAHSPFTFTLKREDREQDIDAISTTLPAGLLASVANVTQCPEPQAATGNCSASSEVGTTTVGVGSGQDPFYDTGHVYFTGPYDGDPFGLSVVIAADAGPFNLGTVIVRVGLHIDPSTAQVTATSSPFPQIIDGVPLRIRTVNVTLSNPAFMFNPTSCSGSSITGTVASTQGAKAAVSSPFATSGCRNLPFRPKFSASTAGRASKASGASLDVRVTSKGGPQAGGGEANIKSVKVDLPKQLPSRLTTLQKACTEAQFNANPAGCPAASDVGTASASTPILAHPLAGPAYLVSHGGAAFPDLEIILQGEGVELVLDGNTNIKKGITSSDFKTVPDAPISSFELKLPTGKFSVLGSNLSPGAKYDFCGQALAMPAEIMGQNGAVVKQTTKVGVTGCPKTKKTKHKRAKKVSKSNRRGK
jgi:uncharacterized repeat protein (TIGR01451 family)